MLEQPCNRRHRVTPSAHVQHEPIAHIPIAHIKLNRKARLSKHPPRWIGKIDLRQNFQNSLNDVFPRSKWRRTVLRGEGIETLDFRR